MCIQSIQLLSLPPGVSKFVSFFIRQNPESIKPQNLNSCFPLPVFKVLSSEIHLVGWYGTYVYLGISIKCISMFGQTKNFK